MEITQAILLLTVVAMGTSLPELIIALPVHARAEAILHDDHETDTNGRRSVNAIGTLLMILGAMLGFATGIALFAGWNPLHLTWLLSVGMVKLVLLGAVGLMGVGAALTRLARRAAARERV